ncbi:MAG: beta-galactosidase [Spirochaetes bacterium]|nr:beta-galactosidase [Spirochaetota bacterium]
MASGLSFGVDWYPEQWDEGMWERDADRMKEFGVDIVRLMEFAWAVIEPEPGRFDFSLFDRAITLLASRGIRVIVGTPTAAIPAWLVDMDPSVLTEHPTRISADFGRRHAACYSNPTYRERSLAVTRAIADRYGAHPAVAGFQIDNEIAFEGTDRCVCPACRSLWHGWLARKYGDIASLNASWGTVFWSETYSRFDQVPVPRRQSGASQNPALWLDYDRYMSDSVVSFSDAQIGILRAVAGSSKWITTNFYPAVLSNAVDAEALTEKMDFASWDNYPVWGDMTEPDPWMIPAFRETLVRGFGGTGLFTVMEQMSGIQGHVCLGHLPPERRVALWTNQAIARGGDRIVYFRWRTAPFAQEQLCYGIFDTDDRETERARVLRGNIKVVRETFGSFAGVPVKSRACVLHSKDDARLLREQHLSKALKPAGAPDWMNPGYDTELARWFAPYCVLNVNADVKSVASVKLEDYSLVSLPLYQMADPAFVERLASWVDSGGTLVLGYRAGARDLSNRNVAEPLPGLFRALAGITVPRFEALGDTTARIRVGLFPARGGVWADLIEPETAAPVAYWADRNKFYSGLPCATVNRLGSGRVYYIGTSPDPAAIFLLYRRILKSAGMKPRFFGEGIEIVDRTTEDGREVSAILNHTARRRRILGAKVGPYGIAVAEKRPM